MGGLPENDRAVLVRGNTEFALDLYGVVKRSEGNLLFSPAAISATLAMAYCGARGETEAQMARVLHFDLPQARLHPAFASLRESCPGEGGSRLSIANALWGQEGHAFLDGYVDLAARNHGATVREVDFARSTESARRTINTWVAERTGGVVRDLLGSQDLDAEALLVLTSAIDFSGRWLTPFAPGRTGDGPFRTGSGDAVWAPVMHQAAKLGFASMDDLKVLELPYAGDRLSMVIVLPDDIDGLAAVEESLSSERLDAWLGSLRPQLVHVSLPRFRFAARLDLTGTLPAMGMPDAFGSQADFSGISGGRELFLSRAVHQAVVEVDEEGTEAGAGMALVLKKGGSRRFAADHPFLFLIRDRRSGSILFLGRVVDPTARQV
jgi:serpin B